MRNQKNNTFYTNKSDKKENNIKVKESKNTIKIKYI